MDGFEEIHDAIEDIEDESQDVTATIDGGLPPPPKRQISDLTESQDPQEEMAEGVELDEATLSKFQTYIERARERKAQFKYERALEYFNKALRLMPGDKQLQNKIKKIQARFFSYFSHNGRFGFRCCCSKFAFSSSSSFGR